MSSLSMKTNQVFFLCSFCTSIGSLVGCSYTSPVMMSRFVNAGNNVFSFSNSVVKNYSSLTTFPCLSQGYPYS